MGFDFLGAADALELALFEHAQQLALNGEGQFANFVEEKRAAMREFQFAHLSRARARVGATLVSEQLFSTSPSGIAAQFKATKGCCARGLR